MSDTTSNGVILPGHWYTAREIAHAIHVSTRLVQREVKRNRLRAAKVSARGDMRISGEWALSWFDERAARRV